MYESPRLERFGSMRELTLLGLGPDCDGGIFGIANGAWVGCKDNSGGNDRS